MFTNCPECHRQFRIRAKQLSVAQGQVKCGFCGCQFNALERLHDDPLPETGLQAAASQDTLHPQPQPADSLDVEIDITAGEIEPGESMARDVDIGVGARDAVETDVVLPEALIEETTAGPGGLSRLLWSLSLLLLLIIAVLQTAWFNRDEILSRYPLLTPWVRQMCDRLQCEVIRGRNVAAIKLINRDVREHPRYRNTLLVNATIANRSSALQAFPRVQLALFDTNGKLIAHRIFEPGDYLDDSINLVTGMEPDLPVHFVLEVVRPPEVAVSFEFRFL